MILRAARTTRTDTLFPEPTLLLSSSCSLAWNQMCLQSGYVDPRWIGREWLRKTELKISRMSGARQGLPAGRMIDVHFDEMDRDWHAVMRRIYRFPDLDIVPAAAGMAAYMTRSERDRRFRSHS